MSRKVFINLPVQDLQKSIEFFTQVGYSFNPQFTDETATCMIISDEIYTMLLTHEKFQSFLPSTTISDAHRQTEVLICLSCESRTEVDDLVNKALAAGGKQYRPPQDHGFMYECSYQDLDGHIWELMYMDPSYVIPS